MQRYLVCSVLLLICVLGATAAPANYQVSDVGAMLPLPNSVAQGINNSGDIVGYSYSDDGNEFRAFLISKGKVVDIGAAFPSPVNTFGQAINDRGDVVGWYTDATNGAQLGFLYQNGAITELGTLGGPNSFPVAINNSGEVTGNSGMQSGEQRAFLYESGHLTDLGIPAGFIASIASGINDRGEVVGYLGSSDGLRGFIYKRGTMTLLPSLDANAPWSTALGINDRGVIVGESKVGDRFYAVIFEEDGLVNLGSRISGSVDSAGLRINNRGQVVGNLADANNPVQHGFFYYKGTLIDLNEEIDPSSGWTLMDPYGINDRGEIVGVGLHDGRQRAFLLTQRVP
jgi:probable HAF family extracellular repeat protein